MAANANATASAARFLINDVFMVSLNAKVEASRLCVGASAFPTASKSGKILTGHYRKHVV
jgi:hypothetical protein